MKAERKELADLSALYLDGTLCDDANIGAWKRLQNSARGASRGQIWTGSSGLFN